MAEFMIVSLEADDGDRLTRSEWIVPATEEEPEKITKWVVIPVDFSNTQAMLETLLTTEEGTEQWLGIRFDLAKDDWVVL